MHYKDISFSSFLVLVDEKPLIETDFYEIFDKINPLNKSIGETSYTLNFDKDDCFCQVYIQFGNPFPRPDNVINTDTHEPEENPRKTNQFEPKQDFGLFDFRYSTLWLSNSKRKSFFVDLIKDYYKTKNVIIKNIYSEDEFLNSIKKIEEIKFSGLPNLFSSTNTLSKELSEEILGYGASIATLIMKFNNNTAITDNILSRIRNLISKKEVYKSLVISGRDESNWGIIFNNEVLSKRINLKAIVNDNEVYDVKNVYTQLINQLK